MRGGQGEGSVPCACAPLHRAVTAVGGTAEGPGGGFLPSALSAASSRLAQRLNSALLG